MAQYSTPGPYSPSPFFHNTARTRTDDLAILHLKRGNLLPVKLRSSADDGYAEGPVTNTRFGSYPHSTLIGQEWGSQVKASKVDTGTRGRKGKQKKQPDTSELQDEATTVNKDNSPSKKRGPDGLPEAPAKRLKQPLAEATDEVQSLPSKAPVEAGSGFTHILPPTPEAWTSSLDHRTQVVYTPDYSYVLQRLRARPGSRIIEAGAGSGSFTHAAARAVFDGFSHGSSTANSLNDAHGKVYSFEYHEPRVHTLREELHAHGLDGIVELTHRDVCNDGFALDDSSGCPNADAIFLDLPAPWLALNHVTRSSPNCPLNPNAAVHLCTFSPCIEQVMATTNGLRKAGWTEIQMVEIQNRRLDVRREHVGLQNEGLRGVNATAANVEEALDRLREVENKFSEFQAIAKKGAEPNGTEGGNENGRKIPSKQERLAKIRADAQQRKMYKEGNLVHRTEPEVKTHTSYLVFAVLPREWREEDEAACLEKWPADEIMAGIEKDDKTAQVEKKT